MHSELIMLFQCIEYTLKRIYSGMSSEDFSDGMEMLETSNWGNTLRLLKQLDESDGDPWLSASDYEQLDNLREVRNYWVHQCYLDFLCIKDPWQQESRFQKTANRLTNEYNRTRRLLEKLEDRYNAWFRE